MQREQDDEDEEAAQIRSFLLWSAEQGISDSSPSTQLPSATSSLSCLGHTLFVSHFPEAGGRGLAAARDLRKGELILKVPREALMTSKSLMMKDDTLSFAFNKHPYLSSTQILAVALLNEVSKGKRSWWYPYLKQMPRSYETLASFSQLEIRALQLDDAVWAAEKAVTKADLDWKGAKPILCELKLKPQICTFKAWLWASATISSRTMHISWDDAGCLCPVGDFFNYAAPGEEPSRSEYLGTCLKGSSLQYCPLGEENPNMLGDEVSEMIAERLIDAGYEEDVAAYCFYARRNYKKGEQVLLSYGTYTNLELLEHYGFLLNENPNDKAFIPLEQDMYLLCSWPRESLYIHHDGNPSFALLSTLRLWAIPGNQRRSTGHLAYSGCQLSAENEVTVMTWLAEKCRAVLESLPTSIEHDELLLKIIEKLQDVSYPMELDEKQSSSSRELLAFLEANAMKDKEIYLISLIASTHRKSSYRLQLGVKWRLNYKKTLSNCINHCTEVVNTCLAVSKPPRIL